MSGPRGQAFRWLHRGCNLVLGLVVALGLCVGALAWRLAEAPLELPALARQIEASANRALAGTRLEVGRAAIAWEGFRGGSAAPLDIVLRNVRLRDAEGTLRVELPDAAITLSARALLRGMVAPSVIELRQPRVLAVLREDGSLGLSLRPAYATAEAESGEDALGLLAALMQPASEGAAYAALRRLRVNGGEVILAEAATGRRWTLADPRIDLRRAEAGGLAGEGSAMLHAGQAVFPVRLSGAASGTPMTLSARIALPALRPAELAEISPGLAPLGVLDAPVALTAGARFDARGQPEAMELGLEGGVGLVAIGAARLPIAGFSARLSGGARALKLEAARLALSAGPVLQATGEARLADGAWTARVDLTASPLDFAEAAAIWPAGLAPIARAAALRALPAGRLRDLRARVELAAPEALDRLDWRTARLGLGLDQAVLNLGPSGRVAAERLDLAASLTPDSLRLESLALRLPGGGGPPAPSGPLFTASGQAARQDGRWLGALDVALDQVRFAELASYWPAGLAPGAREWLTENVTAGTARNGRWQARLEVPESLDALSITSLTGTAEATDATVHWLRPIPPAVGISGTAEFTLAEVTLRSRGGRQPLAEGRPGGIELRDIQARFYDLDTGLERTEIAIQLAGPLADAVALLRHPRLKLFEKRKLELNVAAGQVEARVNVGLPLLSDLPVEELRVSAEARIIEARLPGVLVEQTLDRVNLDLAVNTTNLRTSGQAVLLGAPVRVGVEMEFRNGPAAQVVERATLTGKLDQGQLETLGLDTLGVLDGPVAVEARSERRRNGQGSVALRGDLRDARMAIEGLGWQKPIGEPGQAEATLRLQGDTLLSAEGLRVEAPGMLLRGRAAFGARGRMDRAEIAEGALGETRFGGEVRRPVRDGGPWQVTLRGPVFDLRPILAPADPAPPPSPADPNEPPVALDLGFERVTMGAGRDLFAVQLNARTDGRGLLREARANGRTVRAAGPGHDFALVVTPRGTERALRLDAEDGGALLRALDLVDSIERGRLAVNGSWRELRRGAALTGTAELDQFVLRDAPAAAKLLQAMTLYGLVEAMQGGNGLVFARLVAPFNLTPAALVLNDARAFSASLGVTAKGRIRRADSTAEFEGTIVPAYMFNTLLGNIPLLGRLFSPEAGGGLFAATWRLQGRLADPQVVVNPLAALTPGFLRGIFGLGRDGTPPPRPGAVPGPGALPGAVPE